MTSHVALTYAETDKAERLAERLRISEHAQQQAAARLAFLGELERLCRQHNNRLPIAVLRHVYRTRNSETAEFVLTHPDHHNQEAQHG